MTEYQQGPAWQALSEGRFQEAEELFMASFQQEPEYKWHFRGVILSLMGQKRWGEAAECSALLLEDPEHRSWAWDQSADCYYQLHDVEKWVHAHYQALSCVTPTVDRLVQFARRLMMINQIGEARRLLLQAKRLDPRSVKAHHYLAQLQLSSGETQAAIQTLSTIAAIEPEHPSTLQKLGELLNQKIPTWHFPMMNDRPRNEAFEKAIKARLEPGDTVLDIGCGAGLLSLMALRAGATQVYAIEGEEEVAAVAEEIFKRNGYEDDVHLLVGRSTTQAVGRDLPERADLLLSEIFDVSLLGEDALYTFKHAHEKLLKPGAKVIPAGARVWCVLVESDELRARFHVDQSCGFDLSPFNRLRDPRVLQLDLNRFTYRSLTEPIMAMSFDFESEIELSGDQLACTPIVNSGRPDGFIFWYDLILAPATETTEEIVLSTSPHQEGTHWLQGFAPCYREVAPVEVGEMATFICAFQRFLLWFQLL